MNHSRRGFLKTTLAATAAITGSQLPGCADRPKDAETKPGADRFQLSLAEWSLHRTIRKGELKNIDFPRYAKEKFGIHGVEYVNSFFKQQAKDMAYLKDLKGRADSEGVRNVLIMCDGEGQLGAKQEKARLQTVENHKKWVEAAKFLGCHSIRVNAGGPGSREELAKQVIDGLTRLSTFAKDFNINVIVENHGGLSSDGAWLADVLKTVGMDNCGALPDFGNFHQYDRYQGIKDLMPYAKGVSAKSREFNAEGDEVQTDYLKAMKLVAEAGYEGYVGIEYEGKTLSEHDGIVATKKLLERVFPQV